MTLDCVRKLEDQETRPLNYACNGIKLLKVWLYLAFWSVTARMNSFDLGQKSKVGLTTSVFVHNKFLSYNSKDSHEEDNRQTPAQEQGKKNNFCRRDTF